MSTAIAMISTTGQAFTDSGVLTDNFSSFAGPLKVYMGVLMLVGRLEIFTIIIMFTRALWNRNK